MYTNARTNPIVIAVDHGYGNMKTANTCFRTGVTACEQEPIFRQNLLVYEGRYYLIGEEHKEFSQKKMEDDDYYLLTLAAIGYELGIRELTSASVYLAVGLPLTWVSSQKEDFKAYLLRNETADFCFRGTDYHVEFVGADVFPQGFSAVAERLRDFTGTNLLCDIGNGTMNLMYISNGKPLPNKCFTEKYGTYQCTLRVREKLMRKFGVTVEDSVIEDVLRNGTADIGERYLAVIRSEAQEYANGILRELREHGYHPELMRLYVMGGGSCLVKNFCTYDRNRVTINDDICATAKGYEAMAKRRLRKNGGLA